MNKRLKRLTIVGMAVFGIGATTVACEPDVGACVVYYYEGLGSGRNEAWCTEAAGDGEIRSWINWYGGGILRTAYGPWVDASSRQHSVSSYGGGGQYRDHGCDLRQPDGTIVWDAGCHDASS